MTRLNEKDLVIHLPAQPVDTSNTVIVADLYASIEVDSVRFVTTDMPTRLLAFDARQQGKGFSFGDGKTDRFYVEGWKTKDQSVSWSFRTSASANFRLVAK